MKTLTLTWLFFFAGFNGALASSSFLAPTATAAKTLGRIKASYIRFIAIQTQSILQNDSRFYSSLNELQTLLNKEASLTPNETKRLWRLFHEGIEPTLQKATQNAGLIETFLIQSNPALGDLEDRKYLVYDFIDKFNKVMTTFVFTKGLLEFKGMLDKPLPVQTLETLKHTTQRLQKIIFALDQVAGWQKLDKTAFTDYHESKGLPEYMIQQVMRSQASDNNFIPGYYHGMPDMASPMSPEELNRARVSILRFTAIQTKDILDAQPSFRSVLQNLIHTMKNEPTLDMDSHGGYWEHILQTLFPVLEAASARGQLIFDYIVQENTTLGDRQARRMIIHDFIDKFNKVRNTLGILQNEYADHRSKALALNDDYAYDLLSTLKRLENIIYIIDNAALWVRLDPSLSQVYSELDSTPEHMLHLILESQANDPKFRPGGYYVHPGLFSQAA